MQKTLNALSGVWGSFRQLPLATQVASGTLAIMVVALGVISLPNAAEPASTAAAESQTVNLTTQTVGAESEAFATFASWPGEVISPNDADVQPPRGGTIISWGVTIGEYVNAGEVLGRLSAAPLTPELATTLAERAADVAQAKSRLSSTQSFVGQSKSQLSTFSSNDTAQRAIEESKQTASAAAETAKGVLRQAIVKEFSEFTGNNRDILGSTNSVFTTPIFYYFGATNSSLRDKYLMAAVGAITALEKDPVPQKEGIAYFTAATQLASASISGGDYTQTQLNAFRELISEHQANFNEAVEKYREALLTVSEKEKEAAERSRDTANRTTELDRDQIVAEAEYEASQAAYRAASGAITGSTAITSPKSGYVSSILGQIGEFVEPGKTVASISSGVQTNKLVRFRIPSNVEVPKKGDKVKVIRPGFAKDVRTATIIGVGTALDGNGAFMADARVEGELEWPAHLSVRIVPEKSTNQTITVPFDAVFWNEQNQPQVWLVKEGGIVASQKVRTGRTFGDAVEILGGLTLGDTYVLQASENITEGMRLEEAAVVEEPAAPEGDGHGHAHEE